jgi:hypothetical protein
MNEEAPTSPPLPTEATAVENDMDTSEKQWNALAEENSRHQTSEAVSEPDDAAHEHDDGSDANEDDGGILLSYLANVDFFEGLALDTTVAS